MGVVSHLLHHWRRLPGWLRTAEAGHDVSHGTSPLSLWGTPWGPGSGPGAPGSGVPLLPGPGGSSLLRSPGLGITGRRSAVATPAPLDLLRLRWSSCNVEDERLEDTREEDRPRTGRTRRNTLTRFRTDILAQTDRGVHSSDIYSLSPTHKQREGGSRGGGSHSYKQRTPALCLPFRLPTALKYRHTQGPVVHTFFAEVILQKLGHVWEESVLLFCSKQC